VRWAVSVLNNHNYAVQMNRIWCGPYAAECNQIPGKLRRRCYDVLDQFELGCTQHNVNYQEIIGLLADEWNNAFEQAYPAHGFRADVRW
jgi:hypothetical protein